MKIKQNFLIKNTEILINTKKLIIIKNEKSTLLELFSIFQYFLEKFKFKLFIIFILKKNLDFSIEKKNQNF